MSPHPMLSSVFQFYTPKICAKKSSILFTLGLNICFHWLYKLGNLGGGENFPSPWAAKLRGKKQ